MKTQIFSVVASTKESMEMKLHVRLLGMSVWMILLIGGGLPEVALANCEGTGPCYCYGSVCTNTPPPQNSNSNASSGGGFTSQQQMLIQGAGILGNALGEALRGNPEEDARRQAAAALAAEQQRLAEEARRAEALRQQELSKQRILGLLKGAESSGDMKFKTDSASPLVATKSPRELGGATVVPAGQSAPTVGGLQLKLGEDAKPGPKPKTDAYNKGFNDASGCYSQNAGPYCMGASSEQRQACVADYRAGFELGDKRREIVMQEAFQAGKQAGVDGGLARGDSDPRAVGACRIQWVEIYNRGYVQGKAAMVTR